jgi:hypothetical protein
VFRVKCEVFLLALFLAVPLSAAPSPDSLYRQAYAKETADRDPEGALVLYERIVAESKGKSAVAAKAQYRAGACYELLGKNAEAIRAYEGVVARETPTDLVQAASARLEQLRRPAALPSLTGSAPAGTPSPLTLSWLESWSLSLAPGMSLPQGSGVLGGDLHRSAYLHAGAIRRITPWAGAGLEVGYGFGHRLDFPPRLSVGGADADDNKLKIVQVTPQVELGPWMTTRRLTWRPYGVLGFGFYNLNQVAVFRVEDARAVVSYSKNFSGLNAGAGILVKITPSFAAGPDVRYHHLFSSGPDVHFLIPTFRFVLLL